MLRISEAKGRRLALKWVCFLRLLGSVYCHIFLSQKILRQLRPEANWLYFFKSTISHRGTERYTRHKILHSPFSILPSKFYISHTIYDILIYYILYEPLYKMSSKFQKNLRETILLDLPQRPQRNLKYIGINR